MTQYFNTGGAASLRPRSYWWGKDQTSRIDIIEDVFTGSATVRVTWKSAAPNEVFNGGCPGVRILALADISTVADNISSMPFIDQIFGVEAGSYDIKVYSASTNASDVVYLLCLMQAVSGTDDVVLYNTSGYSSSKVYGQEFKIDEDDFIVTAPAEYYLRVTSPSGSTAPTNVRNNFSIYISWTKNN